MCQHPIIIPTRKRLLSTQYREHMFQAVPCNDCEECHVNKQRQLQFRFYHEAIDSKYVYFDTLTYSNQFLPHISDFYQDIPSSIDKPCFNRRHLNLFLKRLRRKLSYHLKLNRNAFKYALFSEYGADNRYSHRPHYHIIFFVKSDIPPLLFSQAVSESWQFGRTDGLPYRPKSYVLEHLTLYSNSLRLTNYITKYVTKSSEYTKSLQPINEFIDKNVKQDDFVSYSSYRSFKRKLRNQFKQFTLMSKGIGISYLSTLSDSDIINLSFRPIVELYNNSFCQSLSLPLYYVRKLFYDLKDYETFKSYEPNELGLNYLQTKLQNNYDSIYNNLRNKIFSLGTSVNYSLSDIENLANYVCFDQFTNMKPALYQSYTDLLASQQYDLHLYTDKDIDIYGRKLIFHTSTNSYENSQDFLKNNSYNSVLDWHINDINNRYRELIPFNNKQTFINRLRNKLLYFQNQQVIFSSSS